MTRSAGLYRLGLAVLTLALVSMAANAQPPGGGRRGPGGPGGGRGAGGGGSTFGLLMNPQVREELDLTDDQVSQLRDLGEKLREQIRGQGFDREALANLSDEQRRARFEQFRKESEKRVAEALKGVLVPSQIERLEQISLQQQGVRALGNEKIINALGITPEQQAKLRQIGDEVRGQMTDIFRGMMGLRDLPQDERRQKFDEIRKKSDELRKDSEKKAMAVLTDEQKKALGQLLGKPFELQRPEGGGRALQGRGGGRGGRGPGGRGGGGGRGADRPARPQA